MNYYAWLGIEKCADGDTIRSGYRRNAVKFHPGRNSDVDTVMEFCRVCEAFDVLSNRSHFPSSIFGDLMRRGILEECKAVYDLYGEDVLKNGRDDGRGGRIGGCYAFDPKTDPMRVFRNVFATDNPYEALHSNAGVELREGCGELASYRPPKYGPDKTIDFYCDLEEVYFGCCKKLIHTKTVRTNSESQTEETKEIQIQVTPGEKDGATYFFPREGDVEPGMQPGNVTYVLRIQPHPIFLRENRDLVFRVTRPIHQAFLDVPIDVETLDKRKLSVMLPCIPTPGYRHVLKGEGMQFPDRSRGDLIIEVSLIFQKQLSPLQKALIKCAFLYPSSPNEDQLQAAKAFQATAQHGTKGWLSGFAKCE